MALDYTKLWKLLIDKGLTRTELIQLTGISSRTLAKMAKNETVTTDTLSRICEALHCDVGDIMEYTAMRKSRSLYDRWRECVETVPEGKNCRIVNLEADGYRYAVYSTVQKATKASQIHCKPDGSLYLEQLYPFGGMMTPSRVNSFLLKPETEPDVITVVVITGRPGLISGLDEGRCRSHRSQLKDKGDFFVMSEAAFKLFDPAFQNR